jgi:lysophospholipase L1-like esterase
MNLIFKLMMKGGGAIAPTTEPFTYAQGSGSITGQQDVLRTAGRTYLGSNGTGSDLVLFMKGTDASVYLTHNTAGFGTGAGMVKCYIDDGAVQTPIGVSGKFPLFTGLPDVTHKVVIHIDGAYGNNAYILQSNPLFEVSGAPPTISYAANWSRRTGSTGTVWTSATVAALTAQYTPNPTVSGSPFGSNVPCVKIRADTSYLDVVTQSTTFGVSIDGAAPTYYSTGKAQGIPSYTRITTVAGAKDYYVWTIVTGAAGTISNFEVGTSAAPLSTTAKKLHQYGDSITFGDTDGGGALTSVHTDVQRSSSALGFVGANIGVSGWTSAQLATNIVSMSSAWGGNVAEDVAVVAIGRNDAGAFSTHQANFVTIVNQLLTLYATVLVQGVLRPVAGTDFTTYNADMGTWVAGLSNPRVIYISPLAWTGITTIGDGTHPDAAGYVTLSGYAKPAWQSALGL